MPLANKTYVERRDRGYWITGTRISLDSVVYAYQCGAAPESIQRSYPLLTLAGFTTTTAALAGLTLTTACAWLISKVMKFMPIPKQHMINSFFMSFPFGIV